MKVVLASSNKGKINEFREILSSFDIELIPQTTLGVSDADETGLSFIENAILKARHASRVTGLPAIADDSGLAVAALGGAPGIYSARYAGSPANSSSNIAKLLGDLAHIPDDQRQACFHCVIAFVSNDNDPTPLICEGKWQGSILRAPTGTNGFGYDPVFYVADKHASAAELPPELKHSLSHRGMALRQFVSRLPEKLRDDGTLS